MLRVSKCCLCSGQALQRPFNYAIVDEVDSLLIDEGRNPMLINLTIAVPKERFVVASQVGTLWARLLAFVHTADSMLQPCLHAYHTTWAKFCLEA